ncbi:hypothetical protein LKM01_01210 [Bacillus pacificus]|uniref:HORMA-1 domain-containing protein n=1 Tax=Bacillus cereus group TaxID=86661 RepID=UPI0013D8AE00|nr:MULTISPECIES: hypothetical protein [Bacillus cereus group]MCC2480469.1 hypothetical protein [Bacillus pacificus]MCZ7519745.1 hypothetical protein [Bacillus pacificus]MDX5882576.1 hypothetical protein [Bacillus cereus group sp. BfR-BA-00999]
MSYSYTQSQTRSYSYANVRYVNDKILGDLGYLLTRFPGIFTEDRMAKWKNDFYHWMNDGYVQAITIQFMRNDECFCEIKYDLRDDGSINVDDNVGRIRGIDLNGAYTSVIVTYSSKWMALSEEEQQKFRSEKLELNWGAAGKTSYVYGLSQKVDKQYSSGSLGVQRSVLGG